MIEDTNQFIGAHLDSLRNRVLEKIFIRSINQSIIVHGKSDSCFLFLLARLLKCVYNIYRREVVKSTTIWGNLYKPRTPDFCMYRRNSTKVYVFNIYMFFFAISRGFTALKKRMPFSTLCPQIASVFTSAIILFFRWSGWVYLWKWEPYALVPEPLWQVSVGVGTRLLSGTSGRAETPKYGNLEIQKKAIFEDYFGSYLPRTCAYFYIYAHCTMHITFL